LVWGSATASGPPPWPFNQEILEQERPLAAVQWTAAAKARYLAVNGRPWWSFSPNDFVFCRAVRAIEGCRLRIRHGQRIVHPSHEAKAPKRECQTRRKHIGPLKLRKSNETKGMAPS
jgi:hypothetical protein